jgi:endonuclease III-like uncharacterized protein
LYKERNNIIHDRTLQIEKKHVMVAEDYSRRLLKNFLLFSLKGYDKDKALELVRDALVSEKERKNLDKVLDR